MKTIDEFFELLDGEVGLHLRPDQAGLDLDEVAGWDSVLLLAVLSVLERATGRPMSLADALEARTFHDIYVLAVA